MKTAAVIVRSLLGLAFTFFGLNFFLHFMPTPPMSGPVGDFFNATAVETHFMCVVGAFQLLGGLLTLSGRFTPLGLTVLGPILVNILAFHVCFTGGHGIGTGAAFSAMELFLVWAYCRNFAGLFKAAETCK
jgi:uncharacterized membrane protein YphA (DoxX/SURF4 family)